MNAFRARLPNNSHLPPRVERLHELAYNLWWTWNPEAERLFRLIDNDLWEQVYHNPVQFIREVRRTAINAVERDLFFQDFYGKICRDFDRYIEGQDTWFENTYGSADGQQMAYLSMEFGLHESLPIYAGGLGVLSGDHLKEASDLGLPMVAVGLLYKHGYFAQRITADGWQEARESRLEPDLSAISLVTEEDGRTPLKIAVDLPGRTVQACIWEVRVGRVPLYLLDTDVDENHPVDRVLTERLYNSDLDVRISQYILLGIGGVRALRAMGYNPRIWHMNEGHAAFLGLELSRELVAAGSEFETAREQVRQHSVFTTHTPVAAGNDEFPVWLMDKYFSALWSHLGLDREQFISLARNQQAWGETFSMPILAMRFAQFTNGVSELHGQVARKMWHFLWPDRDVDEVPITHVTNGVHTGTWMARRMRGMLMRHLGSDWLERVDDPMIYERIDAIPDHEIWRIRRHQKRKLIFFLMERARQRWIEGKFHPIQVLAEGVMLDPYALTIGFARRFAPYKRADLILSDFDRLLKLLNRPNMPVQIIFAGKSHPDNEQGKRLIQEVYHAVKKAENGGRLVFLEDYDMNLGRFLTQGVDVWLNTPRRPKEASGTSGQKAALNGVLNFSILDGWWREGCNGKNGWAIGDETEYATQEEQDAADAASLYEVLENEIIPLYYNKRTSDGLPGEWIARIKESMRTLIPEFSMRRMVKEYTDRLYMPAWESEPTLQSQPGD